MFCAKCGNKLNDGAKFCGNCGNPVKMVAPVQVTEVVEEVASKPVAEIPAVGPGQGVNIIPESVEVDLAEVVVEVEATVVDDVNKVAESIEAVEAPETEEAPKAAEAFETEEAPKAAEAPETEEAPKAAEAPETEEAPKAEEAPETEDVPKAEEAPKKKKSKAGIIVLLIVLILLAGCGVATYFFWPQISETFGFGHVEEADSDRELEETEETVESGESQEAFVPETTQESKEPEETVQVVTKKTVDEILEDYYQNSLKSQFGEVDFAQKYTQSYTEVVNDAGEVFYDYDGLKIEEGILNNVIQDLDHDGQNEMLVMSLKLNGDDSQKRIADIVYTIYEVEDEKVKVGDERVNFSNDIGRSDYTDISIYLSDYNGTAYIVESHNSCNFVTADGVAYSMCIWYYDGSAMKQKMGVSFCGSDFSYMEDATLAYVDSVREAGLIKTAQNLDYRLHVDQDDQLAVLLKVVGANPETLSDVNVVGYYSDEFGSDDWGEVEYGFYKDANDQKQKNQILRYETSVDDYTVYGEGNRAIKASFEKVVFKGPNQKHIDWLNNIVEEYAQNYAKEYAGEELLEELELLNDFSYEEEWYYSPYSVESVYFDKDGNVSICWRWDWYMGGVFNGGWRTLNVNMNTMQIISIEDVFDASEAEVQDFTKEQLFAYYEYGGDFDYHDFDYYFDEDKVVLCFPSYSLDIGTSYFEIAMKRDMSGSAVLESEEADADIEAETEDEPVAEIEMIEGYLLENSDTKTISMKNLQALEEEDVLLAKLEIYARHGVIFDDEEAQAYFERCSWYEGAVSFDEFDADELNTVEEKNIQLIESYLELLGN